MEPSFAFVIIPAYNEEKNIASVIERTKKYADKIIVVDDGSKDNTYREAKKTGVIVLRHIINLGKGAALRTGSDFAAKKGATSILFIDSDGQHSPADIPRLLKELEREESEGKGNVTGADIVFTYRNLKSEHMPLTKKLGNVFLNTLLHTLFRIKVADTQCGFKAMTTDAYQKLNLISSDYTIESEIVAKTGKYHLRFTQIPIETIYKDKYKGTTILDGVNIALKMLWWKVSR